jgi:hypothetical protein
MIYKPSATYNLNKSSPLLEHNRIYFELLKQKIVVMMQQSFPGINPVISLWKGQEIIDFQEDLREKVKANISEKWFYTHLKSNHTELPRIDMLNFLSKYVGYNNWDDFIFQHQTQTAIPSPTNHANRYFIFVPVLTIAIVALFFGLFKLFNTREYCFTFVDAYTHDPIVTNKTEITIVPEKESPMHYMAQPDGRFSLRTDKSRITMVVTSPCYQTDTIFRMVKKLNRNETIMLRPNDYALMIQYFSQLKVDDWENRRKRLNEMFDDGAMIYQVIQGKDAAGLALFNKQEFIDKLTIPSGSLKNIEILSSKLRKGKIMILRFRIQEKKI